MKVLIACACSDVLGSAMRARGIEAWECDLKPSETGSPYHIHGDAIAAAYGQRWDMMVAHPECTYLTCAAEWAYGPGPYHQKVKTGTLTGQARVAARQEAIEFARKLWNAPIPKIAIENPVGVLSREFGKPQVVQPWWFGDDASKATCFWTRGLPPLFKTDPVEPRIVNGKPRWGNQTDSGQNKLSPGPNRKADRSRTYPGLARAIASQWGSAAVAAA